MFPTLKTTFSKSTGKEKSVVLKEINDTLFDGNLDDEISEQAVSRLTSVLKDKGLKEEGIQSIFGNLKDARQVFSELISASSNAPKDVNPIAIKKKKAKTIKIRQPQVTLGLLLLTLFSIDFHSVN